LSTSTLAQSLGDLNEAAVVSGVREELSRGEAPLAILEELQAGMEIVGRRFENEEYFLSELIFAADIFKAASAPLTEELKGQESKKLGTIVLGTVKHDIHDFGKNIVGMVMSSNGFEVIDLGVNVDQQAFVEAIKAHDAKLVGLSCLLTTVFEDLKLTVEAIAAAGLRDQVTILVGGGPADQALIDYAKADVYCRTAQDGVDVAKQKMGVAS